MEVGGVNVLLAFAAGLVSCLSPCVLPLAPIYVGNLAGGTAVVGAVDRRAPVLHGASFILGFALVFIALGVSVGLIGYVLRDQLPLLQKAGGVFLIVMGLHTSRILEIPSLYRGIGLSWGRGLSNGYLRSFLAGSSISAGWLPCIGPTLGSILTLALTSGAVVASTVLLLVYALGLAIPFLALGFTLSRTPGVLRWMREHHHAIGFVAGLFMIAAGVLLFSGAMQQLNAYFQFSNSGWAATL